MNFKKEQLMKLKLSILILITIFVNYACINKKIMASNTTEQLKAKLHKLFDESNLPGFSVVVANDKEIVFQQSYGFADLLTKKPYSNNTVHNIGSVSKTFIALALMQSVERGLLNLDDSINKYLPFEVNNPYFPNRPITLRHLASHTSGITDDESYLKSYVFDNPSHINLEKFDKDTQKFFVEVKKHKLIDESEFLENVLSNKGQWFTKNNFSNTPAGEKYQYSNIGATLAAYVIEQVTGIKYEDYVKNNIFTPLNMLQSSWSKSKINKSSFATRYLPNNIVVPDYHLVTKADGAIVTNTTDMANYISEMLNGFNGNGEILSAKHYKEMFTIKEFKNKGVAIFWSENKSGNLQHSGADPGILTILAINPKKNIGLFFMTNISADEDDELIKSVKKIFQILKGHNW